MSQADRWNEGFRKLAAYTELYGDARVPGPTQFDGYSLGRWAHRQRRRYAEGTLGPDRQRRLEQLPGWIWDPRSAYWRDAFDQLQRYVERHGDARVPVSLTVDGLRLGAWVGRQRTLHGKGRLETERRNTVESLPGWVWDAREDQWEQHFRQLKEYTDWHGSARVPLSYADEHRKLGHWVHNQRGRHHRGELDLDRQRRLEAMPGWTWDPFADTWEDEYCRLLEYVAREGHARVPDSHAVDGFRLGVWVTQQRRKHAMGCLGPDRQERLVRLPGWTWQTRPRRSTPP